MELINILVLFVAMICHTSAATITTDCALRTDCYAEDITATGAIDESFPVTVQRPFISYYDVYSDVTFTNVGASSCDNPVITFEYERIDYDSTSEYIAVSYGGNTLSDSNCGGGISNSCGAFDICFGNVAIPGVTSISAGSSVTISITKSAEVHAFCSSTAGSNAMNANIILTCNPSYIAPAPCGTRKECLEEQFVLTGASTTESFTVNVQRPFINYYDVYADVTFTNVGQLSCDSPTVSFQYELIDYDYSSEYIDVEYGGSLLGVRCGAGKLSNSCGNFDTCFSDVSIPGVSVISVGSSITISITKSAEVHAFCSSTAGSNAMNANLVLTCTAGSDLCGDAGLNSLSKAHACACKSTCDGDASYCNSIDYVVDRLGDGALASSSLCPASQTCCCSCPNCASEITV